MPKSKIKPIPDNLDELIKQLLVMIRINNLLMSRFILQLDEIKRVINLPQAKTFFKFELSENDYNELVNEFGQAETDKQLYRLDRLLLSNKQECPNNIKKYIYKRLEKRNKLNDKTKENQN